MLSYNYFGSHCSHQQLFQIKNPQAHKDHDSRPEILLNELVNGLKFILIYKLLRYIWSMSDILQEMSECQTGKERSRRPLYLKT